jgi:hypothetical protein
MFVFMVILHGQGDEHVIDMDSGHGSGQWTCPWTMDIDVDNGHGRGNGHGYGKEMAMDFQRFGYRKLIKCLSDIRSHVRRRLSSDIFFGFSIQYHSSATVLAADAVYDYCTEFIL